MSSTFTLADYSDPDWGEIELSEDWTSYRTFWAAGLQFATADQADAVLYDLDRGEDCLAVVVGNEAYAMVPPPIEYRDDLLTAARTLAVGGRLRGAVCSPLRMLDPTRYLGQFVLQVPGQEAEWHVYALSNGLRIQRFKGLAESNVVLNLEVASESQFADLLREGGVDVAPMNDPPWETEQISWQSFLCHRAGAIVAASICITHDDDTVPLVTVHPCRKILRLWHRRTDLRLMSEVISHLLNNGASDRWPVRDRI